MVEKEYKIIFNAGCARNLLKNGIPIYDIKPDKNNPERTLFVFEKTEDFKRVFSEINRAIAEIRQGQ